MGDSTHLSDLQLDVMRVVWSLGEASVGQVHQGLAERGLAPTTVATLLKRLEKRGLLEHRAAGRQFLYRALVTEQQVRASMVEDLTELLFEGDVASLVSHLLSSREIAPGDLARVRALIEKHEDRAPEDREGDGR